MKKQKRMMKTGIRKGLALILAGFFLLLITPLDTGYGQTAALAAGSDGLVLYKTIAGKPAGEWMDDEADLTAEEFAGILQAMTFRLYSTDGDGGAIDEGECLATGKAGLSGEIIFYPLDSETRYEANVGWYAVIEALEGKAVTFFEEKPEPYYFYYNGQEAVRCNFDYDACYWIKDDWSAPYGSVILETSFSNGDEWSFINGDGNPNAVLYIKTGTSPDGDGQTFLSYCSSHGSLRFGGETEYYTAIRDWSPEIKTKIRQAFNYIIHRYGSLDGWSESAGGDYIRPVTAENSTYAITQVAAWTIIHGDEIGSIKIISNNHALPYGYRYDGTMPDLEDYEAYVVLNEAVSDVLANYEGYKGYSPIIDIVYLANEDYPVNPERIQPQIVPVFGERAAFDNTPAELAGVGDEDDDDNGGGNGGGNGNGGGQPPGDDDLIIEDGDTPLTDWPGDDGGGGQPPGDDDDLIIDQEVPRGELPKTGANRPHLHPALCLLLPAAMAVILAAAHYRSSDEHRH